MKILNFGSLNLDYVYRVKDFVKPGETLDVLSQQVSAGGKGLNQSVALARACSKTYHAGCVGTGGEMLTDLLKTNGVDTAHIAAVSTLQGNAVIQVTDRGENCILLYGGSNRCVTDAQVDSTLAAFGEGDWLVLQNEINCLPYIVERAYDKGMRIVLNPSPYNDALNGVDFGMLDWIFVNEIEAEQISGTADPDEAYRRLHAQYPALSVLITLGKHGSVAFCGNERCAQPIFEMPVKDTTAAGDTFTGYFITALTEQLPLAEALRRATAASAIAVSRPGAAASIPGKEEVDAFLRTRA